MVHMNRESNVVELYCILIIDFLCITAAYVCALLLRYGALEKADDKNTYAIMGVGILLFSVLYHMLVGNHRNFIRRGYYVEFMAVSKFNITLFILLSCGLFLVKEAENFSRLVFGFFIILNEIFLYFGHLVLKKYLKARFRASRNRVKVMVVTDSVSAEKIVPILKEKADYDMEISSLVIWDKTSIGQKIEDISIVADQSNVIDVARKQALDEVFLYLPEEGRGTVEKLIMDFEAMGVACHFSVDMIDLDAKTRSIGDFAGFTVITYAMNQMDYRRGMIKRFMDIAGSLVGLLITGICYPFIALAIKLDSKGPVVFSQVRIGKNGRQFKIYKFRSMYIDAEARKKELEEKNEMKGLMFKMEDDPRVTKVGKFLRKTSLDELPQFYNILRGDMSLVGTRPPTVDEFEQYTPYYRRRLCMTPGLTGLWQVSGRSEIENFDDVVKYDLEYIDNWSLTLDLKILLQTIGVVLLRKGSK